MFSPTEEEKKALLVFAQSKAGQVFLSLLERKQKDYIATWLLNLDDKVAAHLRGKANELNELVQLFKIP